MSYVEKNLMQGETVVYRANLHWVIFMGPALLTTFGGLIFLGSLAGDAPSQPYIIFAALIWLAAKFITYKTSEFVVTNKRIIMKTGFIRRTSLETLNSKVESLGVEQGIIARILDFGSLVVSGSGGTKSSFKFVTMPMKFRKEFYEQIEAGSSGQSKAN